MAGHRMDLLHTISLRASTLFKNGSAKATTYVVQLSSGREQVHSKRPGYIALIHSQAVSTVVVPASSPLLACRAKGVEKARLRCTDQNCQHRPEEARKSLDLTAGPEQDCLSICKFYIPL